ncbi:glycosyltransferase [Candidatus Dojkabacteria bacterium]|uniref:Glycosyltransferase n=1 Tax=Candidatus Dojkabacteria bacterium TaxID=2099670 RepID=A0A847VCW2_9BACT|nr:glycosyltransferase [Candidatus Dojkabacteria bacterium]
MKISLVLPTYKKEREVIDQLERLYGFLTRVNPNFELIFVIDGYVDNTKDILTKYIKDNKLKKTKVIGYEENMGKGYAVRYGMERANGDIIGYIDADTDIQIRSLQHAIKQIKKEDVIAVIPSKLHKDSNVEMTFKRKIFSYGLIIINKILLKLPKNLTDVGCGLKLFKRDLIKRILPTLKVDRFAIDSEILNEIGKVGYSVSITPFFLNKNRSDSTSVNIKQIGTMIRDIFYISLENRKFHTSRVLNKLYR